MWPVESSKWLRNHENLLAEKELGMVKNRVFRLVPPGPTCVSSARALDKAIAVLCVSSPEASLDPMAGGKWLASFQWNHYGGFPSHGQDPQVTIY